MTRSREQIIVEADEKSNTFENITHHNHKNYF